jgi:beta-galactosidase beta subunit
MSGRLIRKSAYRGDSKSTAYIVAVDEAAEAIDLIKQKVAEPGDDIEDLGLVTDGLLQTLNLPAGSFAILDQGRASAPRLAASYNHEGE